MFWWQFTRAFPPLLPGLWTALGLAFIAIFVAATGGLVFALLRRGPWPLLVQMFFFFFGLPMLGVTLSPFQAAALSIALQHIAFFSEVYRGGLQSVSERHREAAKAIGLNYFKTQAFIILPLAIVRVLPAIASNLVQIVKDTSIASTIAVAELTLRGRTLAEQTAATSLAFIAVACYYLVVNGVITVLMRVLERRLRFVE
jgi:polar amino acid transport system permease protein